MTYTKPTIEKHNGEFKLTCEICIPRPVQEVFEFFANPNNLELITPKLLQFKITDAPKTPLEEGSIIDYKLKIHHIPIRWKTLISKWNPPYSFEDTQLKGPYMQWIHSHDFSEENGVTKMKDVVRYKVFGGSLINKIFVKKDVLKIFEHRTDFLIKYFN